MQCVRIHYLRALDEPSTQFHNQVKLTTVHVCYTPILGIEDLQIDNENDDAIFKTFKERVRAREVLIEVQTKLSKILLNAELCKLLVYILAS